MTPSQDFIKAVSQTAAFFLIPAGNVFLASGQDVVRYLHGRLTQDIKNLTPGKAASSLVLSPQGKIQGHLIALRKTDSIILISDPLVSAHEQQDFIASILQFKVSDDIELKPMADAQVLKIIGPLADTMLEQIFPDQSPLPTLNYEHKQYTLGESEISVLRNNYGSDLGFDIITYKADEIKSLLNIINNRNIFLDTNIAQGTLAELDALRIIRGIPRMGADLNDKVTASEIDLTEKVSFNKGCYAGQEVVEMSTARGRPNRKLIRLHSTKAKDILPGSEIKTIFDTENEPRSCGTITSSWSSTQTGETYCLGFVKNLAAENLKFWVEEQELTKIS